MPALIWKDLYLNRFLFLYSIGLTTLIYLLALVTGEEALVMIARTSFHTYALLMVPFFAFSWAETEEKHRTLGFLRTLPVPPRHIVGAAFLAILGHAVFVVLILSVLAGLAADLPPVQHQASIPYLLPAALTLPVAGLILAVFLRAGLKEARTALLAGMSLFYLIPLVAGGKEGFVRIFRVLAGEYAVRPDLRVLLILASLALYAAEYAAGAWFFTRRELP